MACVRLTPAVRRVSARTRLTSRASARRDPTSRFGFAGEAEAEKLARRGARYRALRAVDLQLEAPGQKAFDARHDALPRSPALHIDIAVIGVADEAMTAPLQFLVQYVQHQVRQQRRERTALRRPLVGRPDQPIRQHARGQKAADQPPDALVAYPFCDQPHQQVVVDPVEELLQVDVHYPAPARRNQFLRPRHRLMRRAARPKPVAARAERPVPFALQHLQHRLLDEAVENRRDAEGALAPTRLGDLDPPYWKRPVGAVEQLGADRRPVLLQVGRQFRDGHPIDPRRPLVALHLSQRFFQIVACDNHLHQLPATPRRSRRALHRGPRHRVFGPSGQTAWGFTPHRFAKGQLQLVVLPLGPHEQPALQAPFHRSGLRRVRPATMPSADFCHAITGSREPASPDCETRRRSPEVSSTAFAAHPPNLLLRSLMVWTSRFPARSSGLTSLVIRFLSIGSRLCSTLPSDPASRRRPCASLILRSIKLDSGLAPPSCRACSAHWLAGTRPAKDEIGGAMSLPSSLREFPRTALRYAGAGR